MISAAPIQWEFQWPPAARIRGKRRRRL